jgi:nicotinamide mononucleotide transporter
VIDALSTQLAAAWRSTSWIEAFAAVLAIVYLLLAIGRRRSCWSAAFISSCLYVLVLFRARLYMESVLNLFYAAMAVYGYRQWRTAAAAGLPEVRRWRWKRHLGGAAGVCALSVVTSLLLRRFTAAAWPFADSLVTWASVFATFLVARKVYENWHWWLLIDSAALILYFNRRLYATVLLFALYLVMILFGMRAWRRGLPVAEGAGA